MFGQEDRRAAQYRACKKKRPQEARPEAASRTLLLLSPAFVVLLDPHAARFLAVGLILCIQNPGKGRGGESGCKRQANERQQKSLHGGCLLRNNCLFLSGAFCAAIRPTRTGSNVEPPFFVHLCLAMWSQFWASPVRVSCR
jgi:hypothetical protein